jgi:hypothetical protein
MIRSKRKLKPDPKNLTQLAREEIGAVAQEAADQVMPIKKDQSVTKPPPQPSVPDEKIADDNKEEDLRKVRARLLDLKKELDLSEEKIQQKREEKAKIRDPVVEGVEEGKKQEEDNNLPPAPPQTASRPKRGLPQAIGQPEKRKRR